MSIKRHPPGQLLPEVNNIAELLQTYYVYVKPMYVFERGSTRIGVEELRSDIGIYQGHLSCTFTPDFSP